MDATKDTSGSLESDALILEPLCAAKSVGVACASCNSTTLTRSGKNKMSAEQQSMGQRSKIRPPMYRRSNARFNERKRKPARSRCELSFRIGCLGMGLGLDWLLLTGRCGRRGRGARGVLVRFLRRRARTSDHCVGIQRLCGLRRTLEARACEKGDLKISAQSEKIWKHSNSMKKAIRVIFSSLERAPRLTRRHGMLGEPINCSRGARACLAELRHGAEANLPQ